MQYPMGGLSGTVGTLSVKLRTNQNKNVKGGAQVYLRLGRKPSSHVFDARSVAPDAEGTHKVECMAWATLPGQMIINARSCLVPFGCHEPVSYPVDPCPIGMCTPVASCCALVRSLATCSLHHISSDVLCCQIMVDAPKSGEWVIGVTMGSEGKHTASMSISAETDSEEPIPEWVIETFAQVDDGEVACAWGRLEFMGVLGAHGGHEDEWECMGCMRVLFGAAWCAWAVWDAAHCRWDGAPNPVCTRDTPKAMCTRDAQPIPPWIH